MWFIPVMILNSCRSKMLPLLLALIACFVSSGADADDVSVQANSLEERFHIGKYSFSEVRKIWTSELIAPFAEAFRMFPTLHECGFQNQVNDHLRWERFVTKPQIQVCLFHLAGHLRTPDALSNWFASKGFSSQFQDDFGQYPSEKPITVHASINSKSDHAPDLSNLRIPHANVTFRSISIGIKFSREGAPYSSNVTVRWEWK